VEHELAATASTTAWSGGQQPTCRSSSAYLFSGRRAGKQSLTAHSESGVRLVQIDQRGRNSCFFPYNLVIFFQSSALRRAGSEQEQYSFCKTQEAARLTTSCVRSRSLLARPELAHFPVAKLFPFCRASISSRHTPTAHAAPCNAISGVIMGLVWSLERTEHPMTETESATLSESTSVLESLKHSQLRARPWICGWSTGE
jgi:hypothetical protein